MKYRVVTFLTLNKGFKFVDLGDMAYGEWIVYDQGIPKFHIDCFRENSKSDSLINELLQKGDWTIESVLKEINRLRDIQLNLGKRPLIEIIVRSEPKEMDLKPLPLNWLEELISTSTHEC